MNMHLDSKNKIITRDDLINEIREELKKTEYAVDPAVQMVKEKSRLSRMAISSVKLNFIFAIILLISVSGNIVLGWYAVHHERLYFAADNGRFSPLVPTTEPYRKPAEVIQYTKNCLNRSFSMDFLNWQQQLEDVRECYTTKGFKSYLNSLDKSGFLDTVENKRMNMTITTSTGVLAKEGEIDGVYIWIVEVPIEIRIVGQTKQIPAQKFLAIVRIERVSTADSIGGISVGQVITKPK